MATIQDQQVSVEEEEEEDFVRERRFFFIFRRHERAPAHRRHPFLRPREDWINVSQWWEFLRGSHAEN